MHEPAKRQLFSAPKRIVLAACCVILFVTVAFPRDATPESRALEQELQAARLTEAAVFSKHAGHEETQAAREDLEKMAHIYAHISSQYPKSAEALNAEAEYLWKIGQRQDAMEKWFAADSLDPNNPEVINNLGGCQLALGNAKNATEYFERAAKLDPTNALYQYNAGNTCYLFRHQMAGDGGDAEAVLLRALAHFREAARIDPFSVEYARSYAETFYIMQQPDWNAALKAWTHYLEISDEKDFAYTNLARVNLKLGHKKEAGGDLERIKGAKFALLKQHLQQEIDAQ